MADLELKHAKKRFGAVVALDDATLQCNRGEVHGLVGQNGAGKSTLVKILAGVVAADAGEITLDGRPLNVRNPAAAIAAGIGMVFQELSLIPDLTVAANVFYGRERANGLGISPRGLQRDAAALFDRLGIQDLDPAAEVRDLPLAQRQLCEIAKVLARDPAVIILDEATSALGARDAEWLIETARRLARSGKVIIYISHNLRDVQNISDRLTVFRNGQDVGVRAAGEATADELVALILGRRASRLFPPRTEPIGHEVVLAGAHLAGGARLHDFSLSLHQGEILGIGGLTGQGQDELFRGLYGMLRLRGEVQAHGKPVQLSNPRVALGAGIRLALVPEDRASQGLVLALPVLHNLSLSVLPRLLKLGLVSSRDELRMSDELIARLAIRLNSRLAPANSLSGGNQQKVVLGRLLATEPAILMLYDSTRGVDVGTKAEIFQLLRELTAKGSAVLFYSTDVDELVNMSDRVLVMRQGRSEAELAGADLTEENVIRASLGEPVKRAGAPITTGQTALVAEGGVQ